MQVLAISLGAAAKPPFWFFPRMSPPDALSGPLAGVTTGHALAGLSAAYLRAVQLRNLSFCGAAIPASEDEWQRPRLLRFLSCWKTLRPAAALRPRPCSAPCCAPPKKSAT